MPETNITIIGRPIAKKNSKRLVRAKGRMIPIPSKAYLNYEESAIYQLLGQRRGKYTKPVQIDYVFYIKGKYHVDVDNLIASINDILEKGQVLENDDLVTKGTFEKRGGSAGWSTKIRIRDL